MPDLPEQLTLDRHRKLVGRSWKPWARRLLLALLTLVLLLGLLNLFGQRPDGDTETARQASLEVYSPTRLRSGLFYEARFTIDAHEELKRATLVLDSGWLEGMTLNTVAPGPIGEASRDGRLALEVGHVPAGSSHVLFLQFQVNPTNVGRRSQDVVLYDGPRRLLSLDRSVTVWP